VTICISIKVPDGLVFAADSMSSYTVLNPATQGWDVVQSYSYANKLIQLGSASIGALAWGLGSLQGRSMQNLIEEFVRLHLAPNGNPVVATTASALAAFIRNIYEQEYPDPQKRPVSGFLVGGYDGSSPFAKQWGFEFPATPIPQEVQPNIGNKAVFGVQWFGQTDALIRLMLGFDQRLIQGLKDKGLDAALVDDFFSRQNLFASKIPYEIIFDGMPLQDAIDYAAYLVHIVKGRFRFVVGPKICGGPVDIAVMKPGSFEWIRRKTLSHEHEI
jgi:hypothetical protein